MPRTPRRSRSRRIGPLIGGASVLATGPRWSQHRPRDGSATAAGPARPGAGAAQGPLQRSAVVTSTDEVSGTYRAD